MLSLAVSLVKIELSLGNGDNCGVSALVISFPKLVCVEELGDVCP